MDLYIFILEVETKGILFKFYKLFKNIVKISKTKLVNFIKLPVKRKRFAVLKSPHIFKKSWEQFEQIKSKVCFYIIKKSKKNYKFNRFIKLFAWSFLNVSVKKIKISKKYIYF